jgi:hypothetical protein
VAVQFVESSAKARQKLVERWWGNGTGVSADGGRPGMAGASAGTPACRSRPGLAGGGMAGVSGVDRRIINHVDHVRVIEWRRLRGGG